MLNRKNLRKVPLPDDLNNEEIFIALENTQSFFKMIREEANIILSEIVQANNFSGIVSNVFTRKLSDVSMYRSYNDQRYPDLVHENKYRFRSKSLK